VSEIDGEEKDCFIYTKREKSKIIIKNY